jgi:hypothetical protein
MRQQPAELPVRSQSGMAALDIFYTDFNDVNFYVEDEHQENLYLEILRKLFKRTRITRIFPLGGKSAVLRHALSPDNQNTPCFRAYIVDRDFDHLLGQSLRHPNVFYLDVFCIENHLLEPNAVIELIVENHPKKRREDVETKLSLDVTIPSFYDHLRPLFSLFFCAQYLNLGVKNCSAPPEPFCKPRRLWELDSSAVDGYRQELKSAANGSGVDENKFDSQCTAAISRTAGVPNSRLVSGKFLAAMIFHYVKSSYSLGSMTFESFVYRMAKNCTLRSMRPLARRIRKGIRSHRTEVSGGT